MNAFLTNFHKTIIDLKDINKSLCFEMSEILQIVFMIPDAKTRKISLLYNNQKSNAINMFTIAKLVSLIIYMTLS